MRSAGGSQFSCSRSATMVCGGIVFTAVVLGGGGTAAKVCRAVASEEERQHAFDETIEQQRENTEVSKKASPTNKQPTEIFPGYQSKLAELLNDIAYVATGTVVINLPSNHP